MSSFTIENMRQGVDEDGRRIKIHTSALTSELAIKAVVGKFHYSGKKIETGKDQYRMHINNMAATEARHGYGECIYDSGSTYLGEWKMDRREGFGKFTYTCGDVYDGQWVDGKYHGRGHYTSSTGGDDYDGMWQRDMCHGDGNYNYRELGEHYTGAFEAGLRSGHGTYTFADGNKYVGQYWQGERHGVGTFHYMESGEAEVGRYHEGRDQGEGARWNASRTQACRLHDGEAVEAISIEEANRIANALGLPVPPTAGAGTGIEPQQPLPSVMPTPSTNFMMSNDQSMTPNPPGQGFGWAAQPAPLHSFQMNTSGGAPSAAFDFSTTLSGGPLPPPPPPPPPSSTAPFDFFAKPAGGAPLPFSMEGWTPIKNAEAASSTPAANPLFSGFKFGADGRMVW